MTQESPMPERDVSPATSAGQALLQRLGELPKLMPYDTEAVDTILAIEQEAAAIERHSYLLLLERIEAGHYDPEVAHDVWNLLEIVDPDRSILDELSPPSSDRGA